MTGETERLSARTVTDSFLFSTVPARCEKTEEMIDLRIASGLSQGSKQSLDLAMNMGIPTHATDKETEETPGVKSPAPGGR